MRSLEILLALAWLRGAARAVNILPIPAPKCRRCWRGDPRSLGASFDDACHPRLFQPDDIENYWNCGPNPRTAPQKCASTGRPRTPHLDQLFDEATVFTSDGRRRL
jgi:hypothetical protein